MTLTLHSEPGLAHHQRTVVVLRFLAVVSLALPVLLLCAGGQMAWQAKKQEALDQTVRLVDLVYESASKLFDAQLLAAEQTTLMVGTMDDDAVAAGQWDMHTRLEAMLRYLPHLRDVYVVNRAGHSIVDGTRFPAPSTNDLTKRDYFRYFRDGGSGLFIGVPGFRLMDDLRFIPLAVRRPSSNGEFTGVIGTSVNPQFFEDFFRQVLGAYPDSVGRMIALRRGDGQILARSAQLSPEQEAAGATEAAGSIKSLAETGQFVSGLPGETRLAAWRRLRAVDMVVVSSVSLRTVVAAWLETMIPYAILGLFSALALFSITMVALQRTHHAEAAEQRAAEDRRRRQQAEEAVRQGQKMEALGKLTGGVAHDFNNLLAVIQGNAELAKTRGPEKAARLIDNILHASQRGAALTRQLLSFSRTQSLAPRVMEPHREIPALLELLKPSLRGNIKIEIEVPSGIWPIEIDPGEWEIALLNIAVNARDAMPEGGTFSVTAHNASIAPGDIAAAPDLRGEFVVIAMRDTGAGIPPDVATRAFEPFFTTKDVGHGTGLGLSQVYGFARQAGGIVTIEAGKPRGTNVTLYLPRTANTADPTGATESWSRNHDTIGRRILLVEDNHEVAEITIEIIKALGYEVVRVDRARKALELLIQPDAAFHLLLTDIVMPDGMDGLELAHQVRARLPALPIILVSGYNDAIAGDARNFPILRKPLPVKRLAQALQTELRVSSHGVLDTAKAG
jgi:two-component system, NtrC family, sensor kinase